MKSKAVFLDRDGTIIKDVGYIGHPDDVELLPGSADAIRRLGEAGYLVVIASNQSGIARGMFDETDLEATHARFEELLSEQGVGIDGAYYCPFLDGPEATVREYRRDSELRKPKPGMLLQAARELNVDLRRSWMIGDSARDVQAGTNAGCKTVMITNGSAASVARDVVATSAAANLAEAVDAVLGPRAKKPAGPPQRPPASHAQDRVLASLDRLHESLDRARRPRRQDDFSLIRLVAALLQMFAISVALWGTIALFDDAFTPAGPRLLLACFLQLASISAFAVDRFR